MFTRRTLFAWIGILALSCMFLMGQETWAPPPCVDNDGDGYGAPANTSCTYPELDCDDSNPDVNPGVAEGPLGDPMCSDTLDNDCDGNVDLDDIGCILPCVDSDEDGYGLPASDFCTHPEEDCDDGNANVNPGAAEGPPLNLVCSDTLDNDCDGATDGDDYGCAAPGDMAVIPGGCFDMGDSSDDCNLPWPNQNTDECPVHNVCITEFQMDIHEVTNAEYGACVEDGGCTLPINLAEYDLSDHPVVWVTWDQATAYCTWAGKRLPTEAEWEYAARGGLAGQRYPWPDKEPPIEGSDANYYNSGDPWDNGTSQVEYYAANGYGLYDVAGNVVEWVNDWYSSSYYQYCVDNNIQNDPPGPESGSARVYRGGNFANTWAKLRVAERAPSPSPYANTIGFRCAQ